MYNKKMF